MLVKFYMKTTNKSNNPIFDPRLGGHYKTGSRFRDPETGRLVPNACWFCYNSPTGAHYWIIHSTTGKCKHCHKEKDFAGKVAQAY